MPRSPTQGILTAALTLSMFIQSALGLVFSDKYRDVAWIRATWFGNDCVTLLVAVPLVIVAERSAKSGSTRGLLLWLGVLAYAIYNYAYYLFGAALNVFFPIYVTTFVLAVTAFAMVLSRVDAQSVRATFSPTTQSRVIGGYLAIVGLGLTVVWLTLWARHVFAARPTPVHPEVFKLIAALDISLMATGLLGGGILLWREAPWGYAVAAIAGVQASLYLFVLSVNSSIALYRGLADAPGELPLWGMLGAGTATVTTLLLANARRPLT